MCVWAAVRFSRGLPDLTSLIVSISAAAAAVVVDAVVEVRSIDGRVDGRVDGWGWDWKLWCWFWDGFEARVWTCIIDCHLNWGLRL